VLTIVPHTACAGGGGRRARLAVVRALVVLLAAVVLAGCTQSGAATYSATPSAVQRLRAQVVEVRPHDRTSFTQGFELADGVLYEGTGMVGRSAILATDPVTGAIRQRVGLPPPLFGEGITVVGARIWQLTWRDGVAIERDRATLAELRRVSYTGEGWGLCYDGRRLVMSEGTDRLIFRDPSTFEITGEQRVRLDGAAVDQLNELECTGGSVWANVWRTDRIVRIDPATGDVTGVLDTGGLLDQHVDAGQRAGADVLNGIAALPDGSQFLLTGKYWPATFLVRFVPS
jgi:glutaminyl-peptide cyclotransferase